MNYKNIIIAILTLLLIGTVVNADENTRFYTQSEEHLPSGYCLVVVEDEWTDNIIYFASYADQPGFQFEVVTPSEMEDDD